MVVWVVAVCLMAFVPIVLWLLVLLLTPSSLQSCPRCSEKVCESRFDNGLPCPTCAYLKIAPTGNAEEQQKLGDNCAHCGAVLNDNSVRLWDGVTYCRECVLRQSPALLASALAVNKRHWAIPPVFCRLSIAHWLS